MFQRIARRHPDRSEEQVAAENADESATDAPVADGAASDVPASGAQPGDVTGVVPTPEDTPGQATADLPAVDAPTDRIETVAPAPSVDQPTALQPAAAPSEQPTTHQPSVPPPAVDLTTRLSTTPAAPVAAAAVAAPAPAAQGEAAQASETVVTEPAPRRPGFRARGRMRRRLRYLRKLRELQARDLGGLVFDLRRFERKRDDLVAQKIDQIRACDDELRALELALGERRDLRDVREPGIGGTCPRCFAVFGSADRFCANCGAALGGAVQGPAQMPLAPAAPPAQTAPTAQPAPAAPPPPATQPEAGGGGPQQ
ncbi:MAG TPA: hypothetical protein VGO48_08360 [Conexibacter sp.]|jgi:hypothetical protein|nr:hypothetical protein [Conexibacter sp.]